MAKKQKFLKQILLSTLFASGLLGCGSSGTGNDQGVSFTLYGMFSNSTCTAGLSGAAVVLSSDPESNGSGLGVTASLGIQNNMVQAIRTRRVFMRYYVEGAEVQPPDTSQALGVFLGPGPSDVTTSLPDGINNPNVGCAEFELVPPEILSFINFNRNSMPELPFKMSVQVSVYGIGTAGDEYTTNTLDVPIEVVQDNIIAPTPGDTTDGSTDAAGIELAEGSDVVGASDGTEVTDQNTEVIKVVPGTDQPVS